MITKQQAEEMGLDDFAYDGIEDTTEDTEYYSTGMMVRHDGNYYTPYDFNNYRRMRAKELREEVILNHEYDEDEDSISDFDIDMEVEELMNNEFSSCDFFATIFISKNIYDRYIDGKYEIECDWYEVIDGDTSSEEHAFIIGDSESTFSYVVSELDSYFEELEEK